MSNLLNFFPEEARQKAVEIANAVTSKVFFAPWTPEQMSEKWRRRSFSQINGEVNCCVPCIDTATLAAVYLHDREEYGNLILLTEKGAAEAFVRGEKRKLHLDAAVEFSSQNKKYLLDIGSGDITLLEERFRNENEITYRTTRYDESMWNRTVISSISGEGILKKRRERIIDLLLDNARTLPFDLTPDQFFQYNPDANDGDEFYTHADGYDAHTSRTWNEGWTEGVQHIFPGLKPFNFQD